MDYVGEMRRQAVINSAIDLIAGAKAEGITDRALKMAVLMETPLPDMTVQEPPRTQTREIARRQRQAARKAAKAAPQGE